MSTRQFDPVFSAALRNELEALADAEVEAEAPPRQFAHALRRPQVWISIVTAVVLVTAAIGVFRVTGAVSPPAATPAVLDPLSEVTTPGSNNYVARSVQVLLRVRGTGTGTYAFEVPGGVRTARIYLDCAPKGAQSVEINDGGGMRGDCDHTLGGSYDTPIESGTHEVTVRVGTGTDYALLVIVAPAPTVSSGALIDPLTQVRDRRDPDALVGDTRPLLRLSGTGDSTARPFAVPAGIGRLRVFFACQPSSATRRVRIDGHDVSGCMNAIAHWYDFSPSGRTITAQVVESGLTAPSAGSWSLLVVPAPSGAKDSPANGLLPFSANTAGAVLARSRGVGAQTSGTYMGRSDRIMVNVTCRGTGWVEVATNQGTSGRGDDCGASGGFTVGFGGTEEEGKREPWTVTPHGDISWTVTISDAG